MLDVTRNPGRPLLASFILGVISAASALTWFQDWMGRDRYIEYLMNHWVAMPWEAAAIVLIGSLWVFFRLCERVYSKHSEEAVEFALSKMPDLSKERTSKSR